MFRIAHFYPKELNLYGDTGNILFLQKILSLYGLKSEVIPVSKNTKLEKSVDFIFMGGGPDALQSDIYKDLLSRKSYFQNHVRSGKPALFICGSYQLVGDYYLSSTEEKLKGLGLFSFYTKSPNTQKRIVGNLSAAVATKVSKLINFSEYIVGFENHNGRTFLSSSVSPFATTSLKSGNNLKDFTEGFLYKKTIGTYLHGPILVKNPHVAMFLLQDYLPKNSFNRVNLFSPYIAHKNALKLL